MGRKDLILHLDSISTTIKNVRHFFSWNYFSIYSFDEWIEVKSITLI